MMRSLILLLACAALGACGSIPTRTFEIRAMDNSGQPIKCLIVVDRAYPKDSSDVHFTDGDVTVAFRKERMNVLVHPARIVDGQVKVPESTEVGPYFPEGRDIRIDDPRVHLFILNRNPNYGGF